MRLLLYLALLFYCEYSISFPVIGTTYDIVEVDPIQILSERAKQIDLKEVIPKRMSSLNKLVQANPIPRVKKTRTRYYSPYYTVEWPIYDAEGDIIYPKGFIYEPLHYMEIPFRIIVVDEIDGIWLKPQLKIDDVVLINQGDRAKLAKELQHKVYLADKNTVESLNILFVPSIVTEEEDRLRISEIPNVL